MKNTRVNRLFKDRLFRMAFKEKKYLLELYNAMNGSHYTNPDDLVITTLEDVVYMGVKNDASFLLNDVLSLWEHQSTFNPNMPVRGLSYFAKLYQAYIEKHQLNIYGSSLQMLPFPQYVVFYNGTDEEPDRKELLLSDAFVKSTETLKEQLPAVEIRAVMLNINWGRNRELMEACQRLREYSRFVAKTREYRNMYQSVEEAVNRAVDEAIKEGMLADILSEQRAEVIELFLTEYDAEKQRALDRRDAKREAKKELRQEVTEAVTKEVTEAVTKEVTEAVTREVTEAVTKEVTEVVTRGVTEKMNQLYSKLFEQGRIEDAVRASRDTEYQKQLLEELKIDVLEEMRQSIK